MRFLCNYFSAFIYSDSEIYGYCQLFNWIILWIMFWFFRITSVCLHWLQKGNVFVLYMFLPIESKNNVCVTAVLIYFHHGKNTVTFAVLVRLILGMPLVFFICIDTLVWLTNSTYKKMHYFILVDVVGATRNISDRGLCQPWEITRCHIIYMLWLYLVPYHEDKC